MPNLKRVFLFFVNGFSGAALIACTAAPKEPPTITPGDGDYEAHAFTVAAHMGEIEESRLALTALGSPTVRAFAQQMIRDHSAGLKRAQTLGAQLGVEWTIPALGADGLPAAESPPSIVNWSFANTIMGRNEAALARSKWATELMQNHRNAVPALLTWIPRGSDQFDRAFIDRQTALHRYILGGLDRLMPSVSNQSLRNAVAGERTAVASHLRMAEQIQHSGQ